MSFCYFVTSHTSFDLRPKICTFLYSTNMSLYANKMFHICERRRHNQNSLYVYCEITLKFGLKLFGLGIHICMFVGFYGREATVKNDNFSFAMNLTWRSKLQHFNPEKRFKASKVLSSFLYMQVGRWSAKETKNGIIHIHNYIRHK